MRCPSGEPLSGIRKWSFMPFSLDPVRAGVILHQAVELHLAQRLPVYINHTPAQKVRHKAGFLIDAGVTQPALFVDAVDDAKGL